MRKKRKITIVLIFLLSSITSTGCWNYREVDKLAIVAGIAIDKGFNERLSITVEIVQFLSGKEGKTTSGTITVEGKTIFDSVRNGVAFSGKKLYWSHAKVVIVSEQVAQEGIVKVLDWINRDSETRADINVLVAKGITAKEILMAPQKGNEIKSYEMRSIIDNQKVLSKAPHVEIWEVTNNLISNGISAVAPAVELRQMNGIKAPYVYGTAIFKGDKLAGFLKSEETKDMLFVQNKINGGVLVQIESESKDEIPISLEIFNSKTKIEPIVEDTNIKFNIVINTIVAIDEIGGTKDFIEESRRKELEKNIEENMKSRIERVIKKVQQEYDADIFGFGAKLGESKPKVWKNIQSNWAEKFRDVKTDVKVFVHIRNSSMLSKPMEAGD